MNCRMAVLHYAACAAPTSRLMSLESDVESCQSRCGWGVGNGPLALFRHCALALGNQGKSRSGGTSRAGTCIDARAGGGDVMLAKRSVRKRRCTALRQM